MSKKATSKTKAKAKPASAQSAKPSISSVETSPKSAYILLLVKTIATYLSESEAHAAAEQLKLVSDDLAMVLVYESPAKAKAVP
jgi:hypothetical protein